MFFLYGCGLRLMECLLLRVKDVDFGQGKFFIRNSKGGKDRTVILPDSIQQKLQKQIDYVIALHKDDLREGFGEVSLKHLPENTLMHTKKPNGSMFFLPKNYQRIQGPEKTCVIMLWNQVCKRPSKRL